MGSTVGTGTYSKYIADKPIWDGDLGNNPACYWRVADFSDAYWKENAAFAETLTQMHLRRAASIPNLAMRHASASSGWFACDLVEDFYRQGDSLQHYQDHPNSPDLRNKMLDHSRRLSTPGDTLFLSTQGINDALGPAIMGPEIFARNRQRDDEAIERAALYMPDTALIGVGDREGILREISSNPSLMRGRFEDQTFEQHLWLIIKLFQSTKAINDGDHAWSSNAALEENSDFMVQYGHPVLMAARRGQSIDVVDNVNRQISVVDRVRESMRHLVDMVQRGRELGVEFRSEKQAAYIVNQLRLDFTWRNDSQRLDKDFAHDAVKAHYANPAAIEEYDALAAKFAPYMAEFIGPWTTFQRILDQDQSLRGFWDEMIEPSKQYLGNVNEIEGEILSFVPRGGFDHKKLRAKAEELGFTTTRRDPAKLPPIPGGKTGYRVKGMEINPFDKSMDRKLGDQRDWALMGNSGYSDDDPDKNNWTPNQAAAYVISAVGRTLRPPVTAPRTLLYLDDPMASGRAAVFREENAVRNPADIPAKFNPIAKGGVSTFAEDIAPDAQADFDQRIRDLNSPVNEVYATFRAENCIAQIVPLSDYKSDAGGYGGYRESIDTHMRMGIAAQGGEITGEAGTVTALRDIEQIYSGIIIPSGNITATNAKAMTAGLMTAMGQTRRYAENTDYDFEFFIDYGVNADPTENIPLQKMDLGDVIIHLGIQAKDALEQDNPLAAKELYMAMAWALEFHDMLTDQGRYNIKIERDPVSGKDREVTKVDWSNVDPFLRQYAQDDPGMPDWESESFDRAGHNPQREAYFITPVYRSFKEIKEKDKSEDYYAYFQADPVRKAELVQAIRHYMLADDVPIKLNDEIVNAPVQGHLRVRGIQALSKLNIKDLHPDYEAAHDWWATVTAQDRDHAFNVGVMHDRGPGIRAMPG